MRAGKLDRLVTIQRRQVAQSGSGQEVITWVNLAARRWAAVNQVSGDERFTEPQLAAKQQTEFQIRYSSDIADLTPLDRILYPAGSTDGADIYDVLAVHEIGRREGLRIITSRRADA